MLPMRPTLANLWKSRSLAVKRRLRSGSPFPLQNFQCQVSLDIGVESLQSLLPEDEALEAVLCDSESIKS